MGGDYHLYSPSHLPALFALYNYRQIHTRSKVHKYKNAAPSCKGFILNFTAPHSTFYSTQDCMCTIYQSAHNVQKYATVHCATMPHHLFQQLLYCNDTVQCTTLQYTTVHCVALHCGTPCYGVLQRTAFYYSAVCCDAVLSSTWWQ